MTILIQSRNNIEETKVTVDSIRSFLDVEDVSVVVMDDSKDGGLKRWATEQKDITYILMDEEELSFGRALNQIRRELRITDDVLLLTGGILITPFFLSRLQAALTVDDRVLAVGGISATQFADVTDYRSAALKSQTLTENVTKQVLLPDMDAILFRAEGLAVLGDMDESFGSREGCLEDYLLRGICIDLRLVSAESALYQRLVPPCGISASDMNTMRTKWGTHYFNSHHNPNLIAMIDKEKTEEINVLEVGCDCGATLLAILNQYPMAHIYGCELNPVAAEIAGHICPVSIANIEEEPTLFNRMKFDYILFGDVLEHLHNPLRTIEYCRSILKDDGCIIASIPNLMHISVMEQLLNGCFTYTETGLLDKTHIHLFTYYEILRMFDRADYVIENIGSTILPISAEQEDKISALMKFSEAVEPHMYRTFQYTLRARKNARSK